LIAILHGQINSFAVILGRRWHRLHGENIRIPWCLRLSGRMSSTEKWSMVFFVLTDSSCLPNGVFLNGRKR